MSTMSNTAPWITVTRKKRQGSPPPYPPITITLPAKKNNVLGSPIDLDSELNIDPKGGARNAMDFAAAVKTQLTSFPEPESVKTIASEGVQGSMHAPGNQSLASEPSAEPQGTADDEDRDIQPPITIASTNRFEVLTEDSEREDPDEKVVIGTKRPAPHGKIERVVKRNKNKAEQNARRARLRALIDKPKKEETRAAEKLATSDEDEQTTPRPNRSPSKKNAQRKSQGSSQLWSEAESEKAFWASVQNSSHDEADEDFAKRAEEELNRNAKNGTRQAPRILVKDSAPPSRAASPNENIPPSNMPPSVSVPFQRNRQSSSIISLPDTSFPSRSESCRSMPSLETIDFSDMEVDEKPSLGPTRTHSHESPYMSPGASWVAPTGDDPFYWYNNVSNSQVQAWANCNSNALLARIGGEGCPTDQSAVTSQICLIKDILTKTIGTIPDIKIAPPMPARFPGRDGNPPYSYLLIGIPADAYYFLERLRCISSPLGTLFFTTTKPTNCSYILSIEGIISDDIIEIAYHINNCFDIIHLDDLISSLASSNPSLSHFPKYLAVDIIRKSLRLELVTAKDKNQNPFHIVHVFIDSPTEDPILWRSFRDLARRATFSHPFIAPRATIFTGWTCRFCHSLLHPTGLCPMLRDPGWFVPSRFASTTTTTPAPTHQNTEAAYTTIPNTNTTRGPRTQKGSGGNREKGKAVRGKPRRT